MHQCGFDSFHEMFVEVTYMHYDSLHYYTAHMEG